MARIATLILVLAGVCGCSDYGERLQFGKGRIYYREGVSEEIARRVGKFLSEQGLKPGQPYFDDEDRRDVQVLRDGDRYIVRFFVREDQLKPGLTVGFEDLMKPALEQKVFEGEKIGLQLCDVDENVLRDL